MNAPQFKVFKSSAGSGKTFTLVKEFLKLCLAQKEPFYFSRILAITFTNKASKEMKERLIKTLKIASGEIESEEDALSKAIREELNLSRQELKELAAFSLRWLLHAYGDLSISTIDRFNLKVIRSFARDLKLPLNFEIEMQQAQLLDKVINSMLSNIGSDPAIDKALIDYSRWKISEGKSWKIEKDLFDSAKQLYDDNAQDLLEQIQALKPGQYLELISKIRIEIAAFEEKVKAIAGEAIGLIEKNHLDFSDFHYGKGGAINYYYKIFSGNYDEGGKRLADAIEQERFAATKSSNKDVVESITPELIQIYKRIQEALTEGLAIYISHKTLAKHLPTQALMAHIHGEIESLKKDEQLLNISDFNQQIGKVVQTEPLPFIYERIGERYHHIMIDEFQDTSVLQFQNLLPLIDESLANGNMSLIVGDAKQSIYRFRGGEVEQFSQMPHIEHHKFQKGFNQERLQSLIRSFYPQPLDFNFRSSRKIVEFNNLFFEELGEAFPVHKRNLEIFAGHHQQVPEHASDEGFVDLRIMKREEEGEKLHLNEMLNIIEKLKARGFAYGEMAVLCRSNKQIREAAEFLNKKGLPLLSAEALKVESSPKVTFLLALMQLQMNPDEQAPRLFIFDFLFASGKLKGEKTDLHSRFIAKGGKGLASLFLHLGIHYELDRQSGENLLQWVERQIRDFELAAEYDIYLQFFEEKVLEFQERNPGDAEEFLHFWEERSSDVNVDLIEAGDAIQMLSIHKSKGLEFPVVIMPFLDIKLEPSRSDLWVSDLPSPAEELKLALIKGSNELLKSTFSNEFEKELIKAEGDLLNMLYVAFTRAEKELFLITLPPSGEKNQISAPILLDGIKSKLDQVEEMHYTFGKPTQKQRSEVEPKSKGASIQLNSYPSSKWNDKVSLSLEMRSQWLAEEKELDSRGYGSLIHEILAQIYTVEDIEPSLASFWHKGRLTDEEREELEQKLKSIIISDEMEVYFKTGTKVKNEASLIDSTGELLRPDKMIFLDQKVIILDYKSGSEKPEHIKQLENYAREVERISKQAVEANLYYLQSEKLKKVV